MAITALFTNSTIAETSASFDVTSTASITQDGLAFGELITVEVQKIDSTFQTLIYASPIFLSQMKNLEVIIGPGSYRLTKSATVNPTSAGYTLAS